MKIESPVLRFLVGLAVLALGVTLAVLVFYGIGTLRESWYAAEYPLLYADRGYGFKTAVVEGLVFVLARVIYGVILLTLGAIAWMIGDSLFHPKK